MFSYSLPKTSKRKKIYMSYMASLDQKSHFKSLGRLDVSVYRGVRLAGKARLVLFSFSCL